jgi:hypothetical protein
MSDICSTNRIIVELIRILGGSTVTFGKQMARERGSAASFLQAEKTGSPRSSCGSRFAIDTSYFSCS